MDWLIKYFVDSGWVRLGLAFRWLFGTKEVFRILVNDSDLNTIKKRYQLIRESGFFTGEDGSKNQQTFIRALFAYDRSQGSAFIDALEFSYSFNKSNIEPLKAFLDFISNTFFQNESAENNKQSFIEAVFTQDHDYSNALSRAAWVEVSEGKESPLAILLQHLADAGCFSSNENKQKLIEGICLADGRGENALYSAVKSKDYKNSDEVCPNLSKLLDALSNADCFNGQNAVENKKHLIDAILSPARYGSVLAEAVRHEQTLGQILNALEQAGCFSDPSGKNAFFESLTTPDTLGWTVFSFASGISKSLKMLYDRMRELDCFSDQNYNQKIINAIFSQDVNGESALHHPLFNGCMGPLWEILTEAGCFSGGVESANQQAFFLTIIATDRYGYSGLWYLYADKQLFEQLLKGPYFEGKQAEDNKQAFIKAVLAPVEGESPTCNNVLLKCRSHPNFFLLFDLLKKAGGFENEQCKRAFLASIGEDTEEMVKRLPSKNLDSYSVLSLCVQSAGDSPQDFQQLIKDEIDVFGWDEQTHETILKLALRQRAKQEIMRDNAVIEEQEDFQEKPEPSGRSTEDRRRALSGLSIWQDKKTETSSENVGDTMVPGSPK